ncbi:YkgJ family cysteine cluster protein [Thiohalomonas denitrificans]|uniref:Putative zinc-or iron-chelating domain-containing protein n=1 Tax=Thiohalomonas denitrificans TaxID=415747 RepID=A0A1G5QZ21_9GAMM|nr:YkgJ family cysteine cluster protein [Thiohalomonas denitrificans]SCZ66848.1 Putative zinc-or iron-chelating domain-containing protein [Thiohalomonas denitrificans]
MQPSDPDNVTCETCKANCCRLQVLLIDDNDVPESMTDWTDWGGQVMYRRDDGWCTAVDRETMRCTIYARRPQVCRDFEMGGRECLDERNAPGNE